MAEKAWICSVCGYIHYGPEPPDVCPICGVSKEEFSPHEELTPEKEKKEFGEWRCRICDYAHRGPEPPGICPVCSASRDHFEGVAPSKSDVLGKARKIVVLGAGIAGLEAAKSARSVSANAQIMLISREKELPYYRINLTRYLAGEVKEEELSIYPKDWYRDKDIELLCGADVTAMNLDGHNIEISGKLVSFDKLILAGGAHAFMPPIPGLDKDGVMSLRTIDDARKIKASVESGVKCVCIGGGILGLETAGALAVRGAEVTLLEGYGWLLPRQLNRKAGEILQDYAAGQKIKIHCQASVTNIAGDKCVHAVELKDGRTFPADLVVITAGIRSNSYLARAAGLNVEQGVLVDDYLTTSHPDVLAAGDIASHRGIVYGLWTASRYQGNIAGLNAAGVATKFGGVPRANTLKVLGIDMFSVGMIQPEDASYEVIERENPAEYFRFLFRDNRLKGAILIGDTALAPAVSKAVEKETDLSALLRSRPGVDDILKYWTV